MNKKEMRSTKTKAKFREVFLELYKQKNFEQITVSEITERAGYNRGTFYLYYEDTNELLEEIEAETMAKFHLAQTELRQQSELSLEKLPELIGRFYRENGEVALVLMRKDPHYVGLIKREIKDTIAQNFTIKNRAQQRQINLLLEYQVSGILGAVNAWAESRQPTSDFTELATLIYAVTANGVRSTLFDLLDNQALTAFSPDSTSPAPAAKPRRRFWRRGRNALPK